MNNKFITCIYRLIIGAFLVLSIGCSNTKDSEPTIKAQESMSTDDAAQAHEISGSVNRGTIANAEVELFQLSPDNNRVWSSVAKTLSDQQGLYGFNALLLKPGIYKVVASSLPAGETLMRCESNQTCDNQLNIDLPEAMDQNLNGRIDAGEWFPLPEQLELSTLIYHSGENSTIPAHVTFLTHWLAQYSESFSYEQIEFEKYQARLALALGLSGGVSSIAPVEINHSQNLTKTQFLQLRTEVINDLINRAIPLSYNNYDEFLQSWLAQDERFALNISPNTPSMMTHQTQPMTLNTLLSHAQELVAQSYTASVDSIQFWSDIHLHILALEQRLRKPLSDGAGSDFLNYSEISNDKLLATKDKSRQFLLDLGGVLSVLTENDAKLEQSLAQVFLLLNSETTNRSHLLLSELLSLEEGLDTILQQHGNRIDQDTFNQNKSLLNQAATDFETDQHPIITAFQDQNIDSLTEIPPSGYTYQTQTSENTTLTLDVSLVQPEPNNTHEQPAEDPNDDSLLHNRPLARSSIQIPVEALDQESDSTIAHFTGTVFRPSGMSTIDGAVAQANLGSPDTTENQFDNAQTPTPGYSIQTRVEHSGETPYVFRGIIETKQKLLFSNDQSPGHNLLTINGNLSNPDGREESVSIYVSTATVASKIATSNNADLQAQTALPIKIRNFLVEYQDRYTFNEPLTVRLNHSYTIDEKNNATNQAICDQSCLNLNNKLSISYGLKQFHFSINTQPELWDHNPCGPEAKMITISNHDSLTIELITDGSCKSGKIYSNTFKGETIATLVQGTESGLFSFSETEFFSLYNTLVEYPATP